MQNNIIKKLQVEAEKYKNYLLMSVEDCGDFYTGWLGNPYIDDQDLPILIYKKGTNEITEVRIPIFSKTNKEIWNYEDDENYLRKNKNKIQRITNIPTDIIEKIEANKLLGVDVEDDRRKD